MAKGANVIFTHGFKGVAKVKRLGARVAIDHIKPDRRQVERDGMVFDCVQQCRANALAPRRLRDENPIHEEDTRLYLTFQQGQQRRTP